MKNTFRLHNTMLQVVTKCPRESTWVGIHVEKLSEHARSCPFDTFAAYNIEKAHFTFHYKFTTKILGVMYEYLTDLRADSWLDVPFWLKRELLFVEEPG